LISINKEHYLVSKVNLTCLSQC